MTQTPPEGVDPQMRAGDADRAKVADLLDQAYADGRLDGDEHDERVGAALQARTFGELSSLTRDLEAGELLPAEATRNSPVPIVSGPPADRISTVMGDVTRGAGSTLAARTDVFTLMGDIRLDLTSMNLAARDVTIDLKAIMGDVQILVPDGIRITDTTSKIMGDAKIEGLAPAPPDAPSVTFTGFMVMADLEVYGPGHRRFDKKLRKWFGNT